MKKQSKSSRLSVVLELEERKEQEAMDRLRKAKAYLDQQVQQQQVLEDYRGQYLAELKGSMSQVTQVAVLQRSQGFVNQINGAIEQQTLVVQHAQVQFDTEKKNWLERREKAKGLKDLVERIKQEELQAFEKRQEKRMEDDLAGRRAFR